MSMCDFHLFVCIFHKVALLYVGSCKSPGINLMLPRVFISYSRVDEPFARRLATSLSETGMDVWIDVEDIPAGMKWSKAIQQGLDSAVVMLVLISPESMASGNVEDEWQYFLDHNKPVIPVLLRPAKIHFQLNRMQYIDFHTQHYYTALNQLYGEFQRKGVEIQGAPNVQQRPPVSHGPPPGSPTLVGAAPSRTTSPPAASRPGSRLLPIGLGLGVMSVLVMGGVVLVMLSSRIVGTTEPTAVIEIADAAVATPTVLQATDPPTSTPTHTATPPPTTPAPTEIPLGDPGRPVVRNSDWTWVYGIGAAEGMVLVPAGQFVMGANNTQMEVGLQLCPGTIGQNTCFNLVQDEGPQTTIVFERPFWIDITEYAEVGTQLPRDNVTWQEAQQICRDLGKRLPTEAEWEYAARGPDGLLFPWGNQFDSSRLNICDSTCTQNWRVSSYNDGVAERARVGSYPNGASWVGALDMAGNLWEWTSSIYRNYPYNANDGRENAGDDHSPRTLRGSSWNWIALDARTVARDDPVQAHSPWYGFRCVRDWQPEDSRR